MQNELKPCPFCGGTPKLQVVSNGYSVGEFNAVFEVGCHNCKIEFKSTSCWQIKNGYPEIVQDGYEDVISKWNRRVDNAE